MSALIRSILLALCLVSFEAVALEGGNPPVARQVLDTRFDFYVADTNNRISADGWVKSWTIYAQSLLPMQLVIYRYDGDVPNMEARWSVVGMGELRSPSNLGLNTFYESPIAVRTGDIVGFYLPSTGVAAFDYCGGPVFYTSGGVGKNSLPFEASDARTYSICVGDGSSGCFPSRSPANCPRATPPDADKDGVPDNADLCPGTAAGAAVDAEGCSAAQRDGDGDGVDDDHDVCLGTPTSSVVDASGCAIADICSTRAVWSNHGAYVTCVVREAKRFFTSGLITQAERTHLVTAAARSDVGK